MVNINYWYNPKNGAICITQNGETPFDSPNWVRITEEYYDELYKRKMEELYEGAWHC